MPTSGLILVPRFGPALIARQVLAWPKICKLAHSFLWEDSYKRLKLAQLMGQLGIFLTCATHCLLASLCGELLAKRWDDVTKRWRRWAFCGGCEQNALMVGLADGYRPG